MVNFLRTIKIVAIRTYLSVSQSKKRSNHARNLGFCTFFLRIKKLMAGVNVKAPIPDKTTAQAIVTANWRYIIPGKPPITITGINTTLNTNIIAIIAPKTSWSVNSIISTNLISGCSSRKRSIFSTITIESSTTIPIAKIRANKLRVFNENPSIYRHAIVPIIATGIEHIAIKLARQFCRNRKMINPTKINATFKVSTTFITEALTKRELSTVSR